MPLEFSTPDSQEGGPLGLLGTEEPRGPATRGWTTSSEPNQTLKSDRSQLSVRATLDPGSHQWEADRESSELRICEEVAGWV